ncbi:MAG: hypothetical protein ACD_18C00249G0014 [uncultured bacterium]|nr:MAG: hypothetical protein ACD_18C00249G0014 [uncultured bacterium]OGH84655.1 MAG: hypothetical protein A2488_02695 [Candidatus Magasanikbacteria bacterium RIFOXYC12_FULL_32_21b]HAO51929.1 hypothetical protein [Candidatus Magasanikbacteria bacterium]
MTLIHERVSLAQQGKNETVICKMKSGWLVLGDVQFLEGYCVLLADPVVESLNSLDSEQRIDFLNDMSIVGDALLAVTDCYLINYEILGNTETALHAHIFPRYKNETEERRKKPVWFYDWQNAPKFNKEKHGELMQKIKSYLEKNIITK